MSWREKAIQADHVPQQSSWKDRASLVEAPVERTEDKSYLQDLGEKAVAATYKTAESGSFGATTPLLAGTRAITGEVKEFFGGPEMAISDRFSQAKKDLQASSAQMEKEQPIASTIGTIAGFVPGIGVKGLSKAAKFGMGPIGKQFPRIVEMGAKMFGEGVSGAVQEKGRREVGLGEDQAAKEFLMDAALGGVASQAGRIVKTGKDVVGSAAKSTLAGIQGLSKESIETFAKEPQKVNKAIQDMVAMNYVPKFLEDTGAKMKSFVESRVQLIDEIINKNSYKKISTNPILETIAEQTNGLKVGDAAKASVKRMQSLFDDIGKMKTMNANDLNVVKKQIQEELQSYYQKTGIERDSYSEALSNVEKVIRTSLETVDPKIKMFNHQLANVIDHSKTLGFGNAFKGELMTGNRASALLSQLSNLPKQDQLRAARELDQIIGTDIIEAHQIFRAAREFGDSAGQDFLSRFKTGRGMIAPILGTIFGGPIGGAIGAAVQSPMAARPTIRLGSGIGKVLDIPTKALQSKTGSRLFKGTVIKGEK